MACCGSEERTEFDLCSYLNVEPASIDDVKAVGTTLTSDSGKNVGTSVTMVLSRLRSLRISLWFGKFST